MVNDSQVGIIIELFSIQVSIFFCLSVGRRSRGHGGGVGVRTGGVETDTASHGLTSGTSCSSPVLT